MNLLTISATAQRLGLTDDAVRKLVRNGTIAATRIGARLLLIDPRELVKARKRRGPGRPKDKGSGA